MDVKYKSPRDAKELMHENMLVKHRAGSHAYGTNIESSDEDFRGIFCADPVNILTPFFPVREKEDEDEEDTKFYELSHFMKLCLDVNPNIVETLWVDESDIVQQTLAYEHLRNGREGLLSSKAAFTFSGYAVAQLKRIKGHNKWINNPQPLLPPQPREFLSVVQWFGVEKNLKPELFKFNRDHRLVPYGNDMFGVCRAMDYTLWDMAGGLNRVMEEGEREKYRRPIMLVKWNKEQYREARENHRKYWEWKDNRNEARSELEEKHGYDTKHAMHLVRLLRMGEEILSEGVVRVKRPDAEELLAIRNGAWTYEELVEWAEEKDALVRGPLYKSTHLRKKADIKFAAKLLMEVQELVWSYE